MRWVPCVGAVVLATALTAVASPAARPAQAGSNAAFVCDVTKPNGVVAGSAEVNVKSYGNQYLSVGPFGLWPDGNVVFKAGGPGFITPDGSLGMKFGWTRAVSGELQIAGRRLDAPAAPLKVTIGANDANSGFVASDLIFATPGCWEVTGRVAGRESITFVTMVTKVGDGPAWRKDR